MTTQVGLTPEDAGRSLGRDGRMRPARRFDTTTRDARIVELRDDGLSLSQIAAEVGCAASTVHRVLRLDGTERPDPSRFDTSTRDARIRELRDSGRSFKKIAAAMGCSVATVHEVFTGNRARRRHARKAEMFRSQT